MKKFTSLLLLLAAVFCLNVPLTQTAEAARIAVLPLQVSAEVEADKAKDADTPDYGALYWELAAMLYKYPSFDMVGDDDLAKAVPAEGLKNFDRATLEDIANKTGADIVVTMRLDKLREKGVNYRAESYLDLFMKGDFASLNRVTGKYYHNDIYEKDNIEEQLTTRRNARQDYFVKNAKRYMKRAVELK
jgi:hypothetical protein